MSLPKQRKTESDADYAIRLEKAKEAHRRKSREYYRANREALNERNLKYYHDNKEALRERHRKYREANKAAIKERKRKYYEANREARREYNRKYHEAKVLESAYRPPRKANFDRPRRPKMLQCLIVKEAKHLCQEWGIPLEDYGATYMLTAAARSIRDNPVYPDVLPYEEMTSVTNPWYKSDYLHDSALESASRELSRNLKRIPDYYNGETI